PLTDLAGSQLRFVINVIRKSLSFQRICLNSVSPSENFSRTAMKIAGRLFSAYDGARCEHMGAQDARTMRIERVLHRSRPADLTHRELYRIATIKLICAPATAPVLGERPVSPLERQGHLVGARRSEVDLVGKARIGKRGV